MNSLERFIKRQELRLKRAFCDHEMQADSQLAIVICKKCWLQCWYEKNVDTNREGTLAKSQKAKELYGI